MIKYLTKKAGGKLAVTTALMDSALIAGSGFLLCLLAGRFLSENDFGNFITLYSIATFSLIFQAALVSNPYVVISQGLNEEETASYFSGTFILNILLGVLLSLLTLVAGLCFLPQAMQDVALLTVIGAFVFLNLLQDFFRRHYYAYRQEAQALFLDLISYGGQITVILLFRNALTLPMLFAILGGTTFLGLMATILLNTRNFPWCRGLHKQSLQYAFAHNWAFGRWLLLSSGVSWVSSQFFVLSLALLQSPVSVAQFGAARALASVSNPLVTAYETMAMPRAAAAYRSQGAEGLIRFSWRSAGPGLALMLLMGSVFFVFPAQTMQILYGKPFGNIDTIVRIFSLLPVIMLLGKVFSISLLALHKTKSLLPVQIAGCLSTLTLGAFLTFQFGVSGAASGFLINNIVLVLGFGIQFFLQIREKPVVSVQATHVGRPS